MKPFTTRQLHEEEFWMARELRGRETKWYKSNQIEIESFELMRLIAFSYRNYWDRLKVEIWTVEEVRDGKIYVGHPVGNLRDFVPEGTEI